MSQPPAVAQAMYYGWATAQVQAVLTLATLAGAHLRDPAALTVLRDALDALRVNASPRPVPPEADQAEAVVVDLSTQISGALSALAAGTGARDVSALELRAMIERAMDILASLDRLIADEPFRHE